MCLAHGKFVHCSDANCQGDPYRMAVCCSCPSASRRPGVDLCKIVSLNKNKSAIENVPVPADGNDVYCGGSPYLLAGHFLESLKAQSLEDILYVKK